MQNIIVDVLKDIKVDSLRPLTTSEYKCKLCKDRGLILKEGKAVRCQCTKQNKADEQYTVFGEALKNASFDNFDFKYYANEQDDGQAWSQRESAVRAVRGAKGFVSNIIQGVKHNPPGLILIGNVGSGKTHLAAAVANSLRDNNVEVMFVVVPDFLDEIRATYKNDEVSENHILDAAKTSPILILDDLGAHNYTEWTRNKIFSLLNYRLTHALPTIITTNLDMHELEEHLGERTASRIVEMCSIYRLNVHTDIRFQKNRQKDK